MSTPSTPPASAGSRASSAPVASGRGLAERDARFLRTVLLADAAVCAVNGLGYLAATRPLAGILGFPDGVQREVGAFLVVYGLVLALCVRRVPLRRLAAVVAGVNVVWVLLSVDAVLGLLPLTTAGVVWAVAQAVVVAGLAGAQIAGVRRSSAGAVPTTGR